MTSDVRVQAPALLPSALCPAFDTLSRCMSQLRALFDRPPLTWWDVVDILIVSLLIYEALKLIRGTRAMQMATGGVLVLLLLLHLAAVSAADGVVADPQRAGLRRDCRHRAVPVGHPPRAVAPRPGAVLPLLRADGAGRRRRSKKSSRRRACWRRRRSARSSSSSARSVCATTSRAAFPLDAAVSYDLLTTIFQPGTPLHDGAVIISEDRIAAAACFLPLTVNPKLDRDLGTRHRAAIGLTEESDAIAVVVVRGARRDLALAARPARARGCRPKSCARGCRTLILQKRRRRDRGGAGGGGWTPDGVASVPQSRAEAGRAGARHRALVHRERPAGRAQRHAACRSPIATCRRRWRSPDRPRRSTCTCAASRARSARFSPIR